MRCGRQRDTETDTQSERAWDRQGRGGNVAPRTPGCPVLGTRCEGQVKVGDEMSRGAGWVWEGAQRSVRLVWLLG